MRLSFYLTTYKLFLPMNKIDLCFFLLIQEITPGNFIIVDFSLMKNKLNSVTIERKLKSFFKKFLDQTEDQREEKKIDLILSNDSIFKAKLLKTYLESSFFSPQIKNNLYDLFLENLNELISNSGMIAELDDILKENSKKGTEKAKRCLSSFLESKKIYSVPNTNKVSLTSHKTSLPALPAPALVPAPTLLALDLETFKKTLKLELDEYKKELQRIEPMVVILPEKTMIEQVVKEVESLMENKIYTSVEALRKMSTIAFVSIKNDLVEIKNKILKEKVKHDKLVLRDPVSFEMFQLLLIHAGKNQKPIRKAALKVIYTLLYYGGFRINEIRNFEKKDLENLMETGKVKIFHSKTNTVGEYVFPKAGRTQLKSLTREIHLIFEQSVYVLCSLRATEKAVWIPLTEKEFLRVVNKDMMETARLFDLPGVFSSHSFRIGKITSLLSTNTPIQKVAQIIGHQSILSTQRYNRYVLNPWEIEDILDEAFERKEKKRKEKEMNPFVMTSEQKKEKEKEMALATFAQQINFIVHFNQKMVDSLENILTRLNQLTEEK